MANQARSRAASASLAAAAATAALSEAAQATTLDETTDFGDTFGGKTLLPIGTDVVNGNIFALEGDSDDFVTFQGLLPGAPFDLTTTNDGDDSNVFNISWRDEGGFFLDSDFGTAASISGTIPGNGQLHFGMTVEGGGAFYTLNLAAPLPEPATGALLGGGLLAAAALRRLRTRGGA